MRAFIGVDFSSELKKGIADIQSSLRGFAVSGRWKYIDNFHLTLKFLDEIDENMLYKIGDTISDICSKSAKFKLNINEMGYFPGRGCLRVLWLGLGGDTAKLLDLQKNVDYGMKTHGFEPEKRQYTPHVTIGQDIVFNGDFKQIMTQVDVESLPEIIVDKLILFKSEQLGKKRIYTPVFEHELQ